MKNLNIFRVGVFFTLLFFLTQNLSANEYILNDDKLIDTRAEEKISEIGNEVKNKIGVNIYIHVKSTLGLPKDIKTKDKLEFIRNYENQILTKVKKPYVLLTMSAEDTHVNLLYSEDLIPIIKKDEILDEYVIPLLASKDKNTLFSKVSASMLNGYSAIADNLAEAKNVKLENNIGNEGKVSSTIWRILMYTLVVSGLLLYTYIVLRKKD